MLEQVGKPLLQGLQVLGVQLGFGNAAVVFQRPDRGDHHHGGGLEARQAALDVQEFLRSQVRAEARLRDGVVRQLHGKAGGHDGVAAMGDVGEGPAVDKGGGALQGLDQVGLECVLEQGGHGPLGFQVVGGDGPALVGVARHHPAQAGFQVQDIAGEAQHRHDLAGDGDVEAVLPGHALHPASQAVHNVPELAVVHVHAALPGNLFDINPQGVPLLDVVVQHGRQEIVGRADGVEVPGEMEVDVLHGHHLGVAASGRAALHAEDRAQGGLPQGNQRLLPQAAEGVGKAHGGGGLALSGGGGVDGGDQDQLPVAPGALPQEAGVDLGLVVSIELQVLGLHSGGGGDFPNGAHLAGLGNLDVGRNTHGRALLCNIKGMTYFV